MKKILVVDDEPKIIKLQRAILTNAGYKVVSACSAGEALSKLENDDFDMILLDIMMPEMDGYQFAKIINDSNDWIPPIVFVSAKDQVREVEKAYNVGGVAYVSKPFSAEALLGVIKMVFEMYPMWSSPATQQCI